MKNSINCSELDLTNRQLERFNSNVAQIFTPANPVCAVHATSSAELQLDSHQLQHPNLSVKLIGNKSTREAAELAESNGSLDELRDDEQLLVAQNAIDQLLAGLSSNKAATPGTAAAGSGCGFNGVLSYNYDRPEAHIAERPRQQSSGYRSTPGARQPYFSRSSNDQAPRGYNAVLAQRASSSGYNLSGFHDHVDATFPTTDVSGNLTANIVNANTSFQGGSVTVVEHLYINAGASGKVTFEDGLILSENSVTHFDLYGKNRDDHWGYDYIVVSGGDLVLDGTIKVNQSGALFTTTLKVGDSFDLLDWGDDVNIVNNGVEFDFSEAPLAPGLYWDTSKFYEDGTITVTDVEPSIPEPSVAGFAAVTALGLLLRRRRQR